MSLFAPLGCEAAAVALYNDVQFAYGSDDNQPSQGGTAGSADPGRSWRGDHDHPPRQPDRRGGQAEHVWSQPAGAASSDDTQELVTVLRERARRNGRSLQEELRVILAAAENDPGRDPLPPIRLTTVRTAGTSVWSREEIYGDEGR